MTTRDEQWNKRYREVWRFAKKNHRGPSRHHIEEHSLLNWMKFNRKSFNQGKMKDERKKKFLKLRALITQFHSVNQYM